MSLERIASGVEDLLAEARSGMLRLSPREAVRAIGGGAALVDIRSESQLAADGAIPGAVWIPRNVLEWRLEPGGAHAIDALASLDRLILLICNEGYQSSLAAASLIRMGHRAGDVIGGFRAWRDAGLSVEGARSSATRPGFVSPR